jgi:hypothetical protein
MSDKQTGFQNISNFPFTLMDILKALNPNYIPQQANQFIPNNYSFISDLLNIKPKQNQSLPQTIGIRG